MLGPVVRAESPEINKSGLCPYVINHLAGETDKPICNHNLLEGKGPYEKRGIRDTGSPEGGRTGSV